MSVTLNKTTNRRRKTRTFTGCWRCRSRKVKCNLEIPSCGQCIKRGESCPGYSIDLVWIGSEGHTYTPGRRRSGDPRMTWASESVLSEQELTSAIDGLELEAGTPGLCEFRRGPFSVYRTTRELPGRACHIPSSTQDLTLSESELLHHFVNVVAELMMPGRDRPNPWKTLYPRLARARANNSHVALFNAIMAHSAIHKANLIHRQSYYQKKYCFHHAESLSNTIRALGSSQYDHSSLLGAMRTLMMLDVYGDLTGAWRHHLSAALAILTQRTLQDHAQISDDEWIVIQSLCLSQLRNNTLPMYGSPQRQDTDANRSQEEYHALRYIAARPDFGFSVGVEDRWLTGMATFQYLGSKAYATRFMHELEDAVSETRTVRLNLDAYSTRMFQLGLLIFLKRQVLNSPPRTVHPYVSDIFATLSEFVSARGQEPTVWPLFIGAVEACQPDHQAEVRAWLTRGAKRGIKSRLQVLELLETVWKRRSHMAEYEGMPLDLVIVDWKDVAKGLNLDLPLAS